MRLPTPLPVVVYHVRIKTEKAKRRAESGVGEPGSGEALKQRQMVAASGTLLSISTRASKAPRFSRRALLRGFILQQTFEALYTSLHHLVTIYELPLSCILTHFFFISELSLSSIPRHHFRILQHSPRASAASPSLRPHLTLIGHLSSVQSCPVTLSKTYLVDIFAWGLNQPCRYLSTPLDPISPNSLNKMALAMQSALSTAQDTDLMDIDIDMDLDDHGPILEDEFELEVRSHLSLSISRLEFSPLNAGRRRTLICPRRRISSRLLQSHPRDLHRRPCA